MLYTVSPFHWFLCLCRCLICTSLLIISVNCAITAVTSKEREEMSRENSIEMDHKTKMVRTVVVMMVVMSIMMMMMVVMSMMMKLVMMMIMMTRMKVVMIVILLWSSDSHDDHDHHDYHVFVACRHYYLHPVESSSSWIIAHLSSQLIAYPHPHHHRLPMRTFTLRLVSFVKCLL